MLNYDRDRTASGCAAAVLVFVFVLLLAAHAPAAIVFYSTRDGNCDIYVMNDDGSHVTPLTNTPLKEYLPRWSPDGGRIVFERDLRSAQGQQFDIFLMDADGGNERPLTHHPKLDASPTWAPDGRHIAFTSNRRGNFEIYIMEVASGALRQLTKTAWEEGFSSAPNWSPDGHHIAYEHVGANGRHIYIVDREGRRPRPFLKGPQPHLVGEHLISRYEPRWSPDGQHLMYDEIEYQFDPAKPLRVSNKLIVVDKHGRHPNVLKIPETWYVGAACWAADGTQILFVAAEERLLDQLPIQNYDMYRYHRSSGKVEQLTDTPYKEVSPDWTPLQLSVSTDGKISTQWGQVKRAD